jgi:23S rRNA (guanosine2251-2'-O)-methyltransferase
MSKDSQWVAGINAVSAALEHDADNVREVLLEAGAKNPRIVAMEG